jgi:hypothetical protein
MSSLFVAVGIDSSDAHHDVCLLGPGTDPEVRLRIPNDLPGFQRLLDTLAQRWPGLEYRFALENPANLLGRFLLFSDQRLYALNPLAVASARKGLAHSGAKSDVLDARVIALLLRGRDEQRFQPLTRNSPEGTLLAGLVAQRREVVAEKTRLQNQLTAALKDFYPRFRVLFADLDAAITRAALRAFPSPTDLAQATRAQWDALFAGTRYPQPARIPRLWEQAQAPQVPLNPVEEQLAKRQVQRLVRLLDVVHSELQQLDAEVEAAFAAHPDAPFFRSLPGTGAVLGPALLTLLGDNRARWQDWRQIAAHLGTAPITVSSGKQRSVKMRFHCDREARTILHLYAGASRARCEWAEAYYQQQRAAGKSHSGALRHLANKWLPIVFRMWQDRAPYDEAAYRAARERRQAPRPEPAAVAA